MPDTPKMSTDNRQKFPVVVWRGILLRFGGDEKLRSTAASKVRGS